MSRGRHQLWSQRDIDFMRSVQNDNMPDRAVVERPTNVSNGEGGYIQQWTVTYSGKARFWISSGTSGTSTEARFWGDHELSMTEAFVIMPWDADVKNIDRITYYSLETGTSRVLNVVGLNKNDSIVTATRARVNAVREGDE